MAIPKTPHLKCSRSARVLSALASWDWSSVTCRLYQSFETRELVISLLDARAGSPPSAGGLLATTACEAHAIIQQLERWERWMGQLLENYISFPMLGYFRSQHSNQAWLTALVAILDYATVIAAVSKGSLRLQANLTAAMGRHV